LLQREGQLPDDEAYQVFNMGIGMVAIVSSEKAKVATRLIEGHGHKVWTIGEVTRGAGVTKLA
jgi:phosphoribosylaminoimidazole (AIR) synthetase